MRGWLLRCLLLVGLVLPAAAANAIDRELEDEIQSSVELMQARRMIEARDYAAAERLLDAARARTPDDPDVYSLLGLCARKLGRLDDSYGHYQRALGLDPGHLGAHEYLGELYLQRGDPDLARSQLAELERLCPLGCEERSELAEAIQAREASAAP